MRGFPYLSKSLGSGFRLGVGVSRQIRGKTPAEQAYIKIIGRVPVLVDVNAQKGTGADGHIDF